MKAKTINPIDEMKKCIDCLYNENESEERKLEALETLRDWCEDINFSIGKEFLFENNIKIINEYDLFRFS